MSNEVIERLVKVMERDSSIGMAGGINIVPHDASTFIQKTMREIPRRLTPEVKQITDSDLAEHPLLLIRKDAFLKVGGENELIPRGLDPYLRSEFRKLRYRIVVVPQAFYSHLPPPTLIKLIRQFYRNGRQAAFLNKFYPQWVIETPEIHVNKFVEKRSFIYRAVRFFVNLIKKALKGQLIYLTVFNAYAIGFIYGYLTNTNENKSY
jgi:GT2 family glycosyltransferase